MAEAARLQGGSLDLSFDAEGPCWQAGWNCDGVYFTRGEDGAPDWDTDPGAGATLELAVDRLLEHLRT